MNLLWCSRPGSWPLSRGLVRLILRWLGAWGWRGLRIPSGELRVTDSLLLELGLTVFAFRLFLLEDVLISRSVSGDGRRRCCRGAVRGLFQYMQLTLNAHVVHLKSLDHKRGLYPEQNPLPVWVDERRARASWLCTCAESLCSTKGD